MDTKQWDEMRKVFTEDVDIVGGRPYDSLDDFMAARSKLDPAVTTHHGHMPEILFVDETHARGIWAMYDRVEYYDGMEEHELRGLDVAEHRIRGFVGTGHYEEEYRKEDGEWKISRLKLTRLFLEPIVGDAVPQFPAPAERQDPNWLNG